MNKKFLVFAISILFILVLTQFASAAYTKTHLYYSIKGLEGVDSPLTDKCANYIDVVLDGQTAADVPVLHYFDEKFMSYIGTHTRGSGYIACLEEAGSDVEMQCHCLGRGLHIVQDNFFHNEGGVVPTYLAKYGSVNLLGHMIIEADYEKKFMDKLAEEGDPLYTSGKLDYYDSIVCNSFIPQEGGDAKYVDLMNTASGIDIRNDINIFCNGYKGSGFYDTVYNEKLSLPFWFWGLSIGLLLVGLAIIILSLIFGHGKFKWFLIIEGALILIIGLVIIISVFNGTTWKIVTAVTEIPPKFGFLSVKESDIDMYSVYIQEVTNEFLRTGVLPYDDVSGLSYVDVHGLRVEGALGEAETNGKLIFAGILAVIVILNGFFIYKTFSGKRRKK
jgi:hypothetical protein